MRVNILKYVIFSIIICSFEYAKNELYLVNERSINLERNVTNFRNNRILADVDNQFDLNDFYQSTLNLVDQFNDCNDDEEITKLRNIIDSQIKKHKESNTLPDLNNVDKKTKKLVNELRTELEEIKKELDNKMNGELAMQPINDKRIIKKDENSSVSEHEDFKQLESFEKKLRTKNDKFKVEYCEIKFSKKYMGLKINKKLTKKEEKLFKSLMVFSVIILLLMIASGTMKLLLLFAPAVLLIFRSCRRIRKYCFKLWEI
ncbi:fam-b protein [Plasmodium yoelii]|uniref:Fam-b protein n=1 Tax=Plasmodium yoelii TaxID=5861 RepID=A0A077Y2P2_PLAYE|nr:fam-b protein [Plasmodium yoelii]